MAQIVLLTNAWGPKHGGINSFNADFSKALSPVLAPQTCVTCVVMDALPEEVEDAARHGVRLLSIGIKNISERIDESRVANVLEAVQRDGDEQVLWWVGHDVHSGPAAIALSKKTGKGKAALFHHMNYIAYTAYKQGEAIAAKAKEDAQRALFRQADKVFAVGPLLRDSLSDLHEGMRPPHMVVPGLAEIVPAPLGKTFSGITFGRLDPANDRIKQGRLAIAGFAIACREANEKPREPQALRDGPLLRVIGVSPSSEEEKALHLFARERAGRVINLLSLPYEEDRNQLFDALKRSSFAMMLSWHEGFGLTGWEAIAAEVPLIVSQNSGLYRLINERLGAPGLACLKVVNIRGGLGAFADDDGENFDSADAQEVSQAILDLAHELPRRKEYAKTLRTLLSERSDGYTWANCARSFADALGLPKQPEVPTSPTTAVPITFSPAVAPSIEVPNRPSQAELALLEIKEPSWDPAWGQAESQLLRAEEACVPFHESRRRLLDEVLTWAKDPAGMPTAIQFRIGSAGAGKTRLMLETCKELRNQGWTAGFLTNNLGQISEHALKQFLARHSQIFVVVDYAETRQREVVELIRASFSRNKESTGRIRIMLLARDAGEWWDQLATDYPTIESFLTGRAVSGPYRLPEVPPGEQSREIIFSEALVAFAKRINKEYKGILPPDLSAPHFANVLYIHLSAMASLFGERPETATSLLEAALRRERRYWHEAAKDHGIPASFHSGLDQAVAILTLRGGAKDGTDARRAIESVSGFREAGPDAVNKVLTVLRIFYALSGRVDALRPDILGERLISQELAKDPAILDAVLGEEAAEATHRSALVVLNRLARQSPSDVIWLQRGLRQHLSLRTGIAAVAVAIESGDPIGKVLAEVLANASDTETYDLVEPLWKKMPNETIALRECALVLARLRLKRIEKKTKGKPVGFEQKLKLSTAYRDIAVRLFVLDKQQEALAMNTKALPLSKEVARLDPPYIADYATCLMHNSSMLKTLGKHDDALKQIQEAVELFRTLAKTKTDTSQAQLAMGLRNRAGIQQQLGDFEGMYQSAKEAWGICLNLDPSESKDDLARSCNVLALSLGELRRHDEALIYAQESFTILTELTEKNPDAFRSRLVDAQLSLATIWLGAGQFRQSRTASEQAVYILRDLANARPEAFREELSDALGVLSSTLIRFGEPENALKFAIEGLELAKVRVSTTSDVAQRDVGIHHLRVAHVKTELGHNSEALRCVEECLEIIGRLHTEQPVALRRRFADAHCLKSHLLMATGQLVSARDHMLAIEPLVEELSKGEGARASLPTRATFLITLSQIQFRLCAYESAFNFARSATSLSDELIREQPMVHREAGSEAWCIRAACEAVLGFLTSSRESAVRGLELLEAELVQISRQLSPWMLDVAGELITLAGPLASATTHAAVYAAIHNKATAA
ncbi:tetratricopeptide repeat protein [Myxococcus sp. AM011]|uniref:P-loop NTPase n=1 Tax=Myxococcus sp. AM011 TaxID=2745200 RepID=UPI0015959653|nr:tetratricopeptide repeat protein [Myxococcus sp. AM011]NVJ26737.1 tetratricopeptide repeat protein [Myxococcus sp. AM011]